MLKTVSGTKFNQDVASGLPSNSAIKGAVGTNIRERKTQKAILSQSPAKSRPLASLSCAGSINAKS